MQQVKVPINDENSGWKISLDNEIVSYRLCIQQVCVEITD